MNEGHNEEKYEYIRAAVEYRGVLTVRYKLVGLPEKILEHTDDVSNLTEADLKVLCRELLLVDADDPIRVEVTYL